MDTSETYIKMCDCKEIQEQRPPDPGNDDISNDFLGGKWTDRFDKSHFCYDMDNPPEIAPSYWIMDNVWLPRQDQLQEMVEGLCFALVKRLYDWMTDYYKDAVVALYPSSMEQLWLAFAMKEKYNKVWDGKGWLFHK